MFLLALITTLLTVLPGKKEKIDIKKQIKNLKEKKVVVTREKQIV